MSERLSLMLIGLLALAATAHAAPPSGGSGDIFPFKIHEATLDNGLRVVAIPYDSPGTVAYYTVVRTGSRDEIEQGHSGFAHFFEHMMFRGTARTSAAAYNDTLKRMGADSNANTSDDRTVYHIVGPAAELETMMDLEADRFQGLRYAEDAFRTEALAVLGEYNKTASNPVAPMIEKVRDLAYQQHTYKHTTLGFLADIKAMPGYYDYSLKFFQRFYRPENCTLVIVGDVKPEKVFELARKYYSGWKKGYAAPEVPVEPPQTEAKSAKLAWPNPTRPYLMVAYHIPSFANPTIDSAALLLLDQLLFAESAPLVQELEVQKQWVDFVRGGSDASRDPGLFTVFARVKSEDLVPKVKETLDRYLREIQTTPIDPQRLERIKSHLRYNFALGLDSPGSVAAQAAEAIAMSGDIQGINRLYALFARVSAADIQRAAASVFRAQNETFVTLAHTPAAGAPAKSEGGNR